MSWIVLGLGGLTLVVSVAWWRHRTHLAEIQRRLAFSEESRFELLQHAEVVDARLAEMSRALQSQQEVLQSARDLAERRSALDKLMAESSRGSGPPTWADTQPMNPLAEPYATTTPGVLNSTAQGQH